MKYRLVEMLRCPEHPEALLRVKGAHLSEVFPYKGDLQIPVCRSGCGFLGNWFTEIPESLPPSNRFDCRRCLGTEIETSRLVCPECGWLIEVKDGLLKSGIDPGEDIGPDETPLHRKSDAPIEKFLNLQQTEIVLILAPLPETTLRKWDCAGVERLQVEINPEVSLAGRARSCANGHGMVHYLGGPLRLSILRPGFIDALIMQVPSNRIADYSDTLEQIPSLLRASGRAIFIYNPDSSAPHAHERYKKYMDDLPATFSDFNTHLAHAHGVDLLVLERPEPENGNGVLVKIKAGLAG